MEHLKSEIAEISTDRAEVTDFVQKAKIENDFFKEKDTESKKIEVARMPERSSIKEKLTVISGGLNRPDTSEQNEEILKDSRRINCL